MLKTSNVFSGYSVNNLEDAKKFYGEVLGLDLTTEENMGINIQFPNEHRVFLYEKENHEPATFTVLNFIVDNIDNSIDEMESKGISFEQYDLGNGATTDEKGVLRGLSVNMGPDIAWFKDPAGNILSILQEE